MPTHNATELYDEWMDLWIEPSKAKRTAKDYGGIIMKYISDCKIKDIRKVTPKLVLEYVSKRDANMGLARRKIILSVIRIFHEYAFTQGHSDKDPASIVTVKTDNLTHKQKEPTFVDVFKPEEYNALLLFLDEELLRIKGLYRCITQRGDRRGIRIIELDKQRIANRFWMAASMLAHETGLRLTDIAQLEWDCITADELVVHTDKRDKRVAIPRWPDVDAAIKAIPDDDDFYCFPAQRRIAVSPTRRAALPTQFSRLLKRAGLAREGLRFHSLRHTCLTKWKSDGFNIEHIAKLAGHARPETTKKYIHE